MKYEKQEKLSSATQTTYKTRFANGLYGFIKLGPESEILNVAVFTEKEVLLQSVDADSVPSAKSVSFYLTMAARETAGLYQSAAGGKYKKSLGAFLV